MPTLQFLKQNTLARSGSVYIHVNKTKGRTLAIVGKRFKGSAVCVCVISETMVSVCGILFYCALKEEGADSSEGLSVLRTCLSCCSCSKVCCCCQLEIRAALYWGSTLK